MLLCRAGTETRNPRGGESDCRDKEGALTVEQQEGKPLRPGAAETGTWKTRGHLVSRSGQE